MNESKQLTERLAQMSEDRQFDQQSEVVDQPEQEEQVEAAPEADSSASSSAEATADRPEQTQQAQPPKESGHFKKLRESLEKAEREKEQLYDILYKMQQAQPAAPQPPKPYEPELEDNDFVPRNYVDRKLRETQQQLSQYQQAMYEQMVTNQLQTQYTDFSSVLSKDNITKLRQEHPEIAASLASNPDIASKAQATYKIIKKLGLDVPEEDFEPIKKKIQANSLKPRPAVANPLSYASTYDYQRMNDDEMKREREAMDRAIRGD